MSKHFVIWFAKTDAARFGAKNVRILSVTPGNFDTPMGALEKDEAGTYLKFNAIKRNGNRRKSQPCMRCLQTSSWGI